MDVHVGFLAQVQDATGGLELHSIETPRDGETHVLFRARLTGEWQTLGVRVEPQPPHRIAGLRPPRAAEVPAGEEPPARRLPDAEAGAALDAFARKLAAAEVWSGGLLVARHGEVLFEGAYGDASKEHGVPNRPDTLFSIGSINKMFTAVGVLQQVEKGTLSLDDPVARHLPGVLPAEVAAQVKIRHLLTHTSGLGDFLFTPEMRRRSRADFRTVADYLPLLADESPRFEPGTDWSYSNTGFLLLGAILEKVSGQSYDDYVAQHVFAPAGMTATGAPALDLVPRGLASCYEKELVGGRWRFRSDRYVQVARGTPAGGGFSTLRDLHRFLEALDGHRLLGAETTRMMTTAKPEIGSPDYGFGTQLFEGRRIGHTGGGPGTAALVERDPSTGLVVVVLGNQNGGSGSVARRARLLFGDLAPAAETTR
jgi:CubicO group peptidase (beta-lactamase class C family)